MDMNAEVISGTALLLFCALALVIGLIGGMYFGRWAAKKDEGGNLKPEIRTAPNGMTIYCNDGSSTVIPYIGSEE